MEFSFEDTLPIMVGHPVIFRKNKDSTLTHVDLISGKPQLSVKKGKKGLKLSINPFPDDKKVCVIEEPQDRIRVVQFSDEIIRVAKIIGKNGTYFPDEAEKMITEILAPASPFLDIQSDLAATSMNIETVESNSTPGVLLYPAGEAIKADIVIMPLGENGPLFKPGQGGEIIMTELEGKRIQAIRNLKAEKEGSGRLIATCPSLEQSAKSFLWYSEDLEEILELVSELKDAAAKGIATVSWPEGKKFGIKTSIDTDKLNLRISSGTDWFDVEGTATAEDGEEIGLKAILKGLSRDSRFIKIGDNEFIALSKSLHKKLLALESASETIKTGARIGKGAAIMLREVLSGIKSTKTDRAWKDFQKRIEEAVELVPELPSTFQAELRPYQEEGFTWLCRLGALGVGACLADDMGLGKTIQALAFLLSTASKGPSLVVAPTSVCGNWVAETVRFAPTLNPVIFGGNEREQMLKNLAPMDLLIVSYGLMQQEEKLFEAVNWNVIVLDEAQAIKNETSKRTQTALKLKAGFRLITTGTPVENSLEELYTLFSFINPGLLGSKNSFNEKFAFPIEREQSRSARNSLRQLIKPFILRRLRTDVLDDLPEKTEIVINVEPSTAQKAVYETLRKDIVNDLENSDNQPPGQKYLKILAGITKLRLACCHPELAAPGCETEGAKTEIFMKLVEELLENRHKALVFSQFTSFLSIVRKALDEKGIKYLYLDGSTPAKERNKNVARFQAGGADLFLISLKAGGTGLNLTAANYVIHLDPWWNPAVEDQASARAHRMGQKQPVTIYRLVMKESIEEKIMALHKHKKNLAESILEGTESAGKMSAEELMNLIKNG
jgi:SNF2 family DNA or RNA helicase